MKIKIQLFLLMVLVLLSPIHTYAEKASTYNTALTMSSGLSAQLNKLKVSDPNFKISINGVNQVTIEKLSYVRNGNLMLPLKEVSQAFRMNILWHPSNRTVEITDKNITAKAKAGSYLYSIGNMGPVKLGMYMEIKNGKSYVPVDFFSEILNASLSIDKSTLNMNFKYANINSLIKTHSIAESYIDTLQKKGYSDISFHLMYPGDEIGSVIYKANYKNFGGGDKELIPVVFNIKNGNTMTLSMLIKPKETGAFIKLVGEKYKISSLDPKEEGNYYFVKNYSQIYLVLLRKDNSNNYYSSWIPITDMADILQINIK